MTTVAYLNVTERQTDGRTHNINVADPHLALHYSLRASRSKIYQLNGQ